MLFNTHMQYGGVSVDWNVNSWFHLFALLLDLARDHPESYHSFMYQNFFKHIDIDPENTHILDGNAKDLEAECQKYEQMIKDAGGIRLFIGGKASCLWNAESIYLGL